MKINPNWGENNIVVIKFEHKTSSSSMIIVIP